jgi:LysR family glycine cleavage system transcriptional activator
MLGITRPADLRGRKLIHFDWHPQARAPAVWSRWFRAARLKPPADAETVAFSEETHAILAVLAGHGIGLLSPTLMAAEIARGTLVQPFGPALPTGGYHLAALPERRDEPAIAAVWEWFAAQFTA